MFAIAHSDFLNFAGRMKPIIWVFASISVTLFVDFVLSAPSQVCANKSHLIWIFIVVHRFQVSEEINSQESVLDVSATSDADLERSKRAR